MLSGRTLYLLQVSGLDWGDVVNGMEVARMIWYCIFKDVKSICPMNIESSIFLGNWKYQPPEWTRLLWHWEKHHHFDGLHSSYLYHHTRPVQNVHVMICCGVVFDLKFEWTGTYNVKYMNISFRKLWIDNYDLIFWFIGTSSICILSQPFENGIRHKIIFSVWNTSNNHKKATASPHPLPTVGLRKRGHLQAVKVLQ